MSLTLVCPLPLAFPKRIRPSGGARLPPPLFWSLSTLPKQVAKVQPLLLVRMTLLNPSWVSLKPNLALLHALYIPISFLKKIMRKLDFYILEIPGGTTP